MISTNNDELIKRIAKLARQNKELEEQLKILVKQNEALADENENLKAHSREIPMGEEKSLKFNMATVLFADIHSVSLLTEGMDSVSVMDELDEIFFEFESIAERYKIEKIKTIGDTFMCAGGIPVKNITNPIDVVMAAMEMRNYIDKFEHEKRGNREKIWDLKIGIHRPCHSIYFRQKENKLRYKGRYGS
jgi:adenylate cyclase